MDARRFANADSLLAHLGQEDAPGRFLYRGQTRRHAPYRIPDEGGTLQDVEALCPNDLRFLRDLDTAAPDVRAQVTAMRNIGRDRRDKFMLFLLRKASEGCAELGWLNDIVAAEQPAEQDYLQWLLAQPHAATLMDPARTHLAPYALRVAAHEQMWRRGLGIGSRRFTVTWSLAQHYELATALVDVTDDCRVALWFATHEWDATRPPPAVGTEGVVYRFDRKQLGHALEAQFLTTLAFALGKGLPPPPPFFVQPIADIPESCARRPGRQRGFSVYGFDQAQLLQFILEREICAVFTFAHGPAPALGPIDRDYLVPQDDPFDAILAAWRTLA